MKRKGAEVRNTLRRLDTIRTHLAGYSNFNATSLSAELGVCRKTCIRDLKLLQDLYSVKIGYDQKYRTYWLVDPGRDFALRYMLQETFCVEGPPIESSNN